MKRGGSRDGAPYSTYPAIGRITRRDSNAPFSVRLPDELRAKAVEKAASKRLAVGHYIRDLVEADLSGTPPRRRRGKYDDLRQDLAKINAAIIARGNQIERDGGPCGINSCGGQGADRHCRQVQIEILRDAVTALIALARSTRAR
jgi:hypothetical protein